MQEPLVGAVEVAEGGRDSCRRARGAGGRAGRSSLVPGISLPILTGQLKGGMDRLTLSIHP